MAFLFITRPVRSNNVTILNYLYLKNDKENDYKYFVSTDPPAEIACAIGHIVMSLFLIFPPAIKGGIISIQFVK